ncbi:hypothetical protein J4418_01745 [Candidatus Woesearchaeota archaeon]|nr:hypothetical protein [Candidatus Woesearchaeota archaeon]
MAFEILIPDLENKPKTSKDAVINILTNKWSLSLREIYYAIKKEYNYSGSYQSVYKAVKELTELSVLKSKERKYEINIAWVKKVQSFTDIVETNYYTKQRLQRFGLKEANSGKEIMILNFETIFDAEKYLYYFMKNYLTKKKNDIICCKVSHEWKSIYYLRAEYNYYKKLLERGHRFYFMFKGNSLLEKNAKEFYKKMGLNVQNLKEYLPNDTLVFGDYFIQLFIPEKLKLAMGKALEKGDKLNLLKNVLEKPSSIKLILNKDNSLADEIKNQVLKNFKALLR